MWVGGWVGGRTSCSERLSASLNGGLLSQPSLPSVGQAQPGPASGGSCGRNRVRPRCSPSTSGGCRSEVRAFGYFSTYHYQHCRGAKHSPWCEALTNPREVRVLLQEEQGAGCRGRRDEGMECGRWRGCAMGGESSQIIVPRLQATSRLAVSSEQVPPTPYSNGAEHDRPDSFQSRAWKDMPPSGDCMWEVCTLGYRSINDRQYCGSAKASPSCETLTNPRGVRVLLKEQQWAECKVKKDEVVGCGR